MVKDNVPLTKDFFKVQIPPMLTAVLADYFPVYQMDSFFDKVMETTPSSCQSNCGQCYYKWDITKAANHVHSGDMYWISPQDEEAHNNLLAHIGYGGFGNILASIGNYYLNVLHLTVLAMNFIIVSKCYDEKFHVDWDDSLDNEAFTVIIPIQLVDGAEPELIMEVGKSSQWEEHQVKYDAQYAYIWGA